MADHDVIVIGASAGGVEAVRTIAAGLPADLAAAVLVVVHIPADVHSLLPLILSRAGALPAEHALDGEPYLPGHIYVAPPDYHLLLSDGSMRLTRGPREHGLRPAVDMLFHSAAQALGPRVIGVVLSGNLDDGAAGLKAIKRAGGIAIAQEPADAAYPGMPRSAQEQVALDYVLPLSQIADRLANLVGHSEPGGGSPPTPNLDKDVPRIAQDIADLAAGSCHCAKKGSAPAPSH